MELNSDTVDTPPLPAATVMMLRNSPSGLEVFMLKRHGASDVLGGAYVFPGGKVDPQDQHIDVQQHLDQPPEAMHLALNEAETDPQTAAGLYVAAVREVFEESGVLFALQGEGKQPSEAALSGSTDFAQRLAEHALRLQTQALQPWSRWVTPRMPSMMRKRFDTRFFVAIAPSDQTARHDNQETVESIWMSPRQALAQYWEGGIEMAPPQIMSLAHLARYASAEAALAAARARPPAVIRPEPHDREGTRVLCYPGDPLHSQPEQAMPGPTRLYYRNKRFEPAHGFEALFD